MLNTRLIRNACINVKTDRRPLMAEENANQNRNENGQYEADKAPQKMDAHGKPIQGQGNMQKPVVPTSDKNAEANKNRSM